MWTNDEMASGTNIRLHYEKNFFSVSLAITKHISTTLGLKAGIRGKSSIFKKQKFCLLYWYVFNIISITVLLTEYCAGGKIENEMGRACGAYGGGESGVQGSGGET